MMEQSIQKNYTIERNQEKGKGNTECQKFQHFTQSKTALTLTSFIKQNTSQNFIREDEEVDTREDIKESMESSLLSHLGLWFYFIRSFLDGVNKSDVPVDQSVLHTPYRFQRNVLDPEERKNTAETFHSSLCYSYGKQSLPNLYKQIATVNSGILPNQSLSGIVSHYFHM